jgi:hypothetical protein
MNAPRLTGLQAFCLAALGLLDSAYRELRPDEYEALLNVLSARLARDFVRDALDEQK